MSINHEKSAKEPTNISRSTLKVLSLLECFTHAKPELKASELAERLGMPTSSVYRYLTALTNEGYIEAIPGTGKYTLGLKIVEQASVALSRLDVRHHGQVEIESLANSLGINANLGVLYQGDTFHLAFAIRTETYRLYSLVGRRTPAHWTAMGKAMYAYIPWEHVRETIESYGWRPLTREAVQDFERLHQELLEIRRCGYSVDRGGVSPRTRCVGAPVFNRSRDVVAAISVSMTPDLFGEYGEGKLAAETLKYAERLSHRLGYTGPPI